MLVANGASFRSSISSSSSFSSSGGPSDPLHSPPGAHFQVVNHGIPLAVQQRMEEQMRAFFRLPLETKYLVKRTGTNSRGYADDELTKQRRDWKEMVDRPNSPRLPYKTFSAALPVIPAISVLE